MNGVSSRQAAVKVEQLVVSYGDAVAVKQVDIDVQVGEHLTLLGPSGCGKTTTLRAIAGLETPRDGRITIDGLTVFDAATRTALPPEQRGLSMVFQSYAIWPHMTVEENVAFSFRVRGRSGPDVRASVDKALALVGLAEFATRSATKLSGGQQQRVALARAIALDPKVVLLDEPLSNLDAQLRLAMRSELKALQRRLGFTSIYVTHDQEEALALSDRIIVMRDGVIEQQGTPEDVFGAPRTCFVANFLGVRNVIPCTGGDGSSRERTVSIAPGIELHARAAPGVTKVGAVCFRPLNVELQSSAGPPGSVFHVARVRHALYQGDLVHYHLDCEGLEICAYTRPVEGVREGSTVWWRVSPDHCFLVAP